MPVRVLRANRKVHANAGRVAVMRGPIVYCAEGVDNGKDLHTVGIHPDASFTVSESEFLLPALHTTGLRPIECDELYTEANTAPEDFPLTLIPYYAFANRGESSMQVWLVQY